MGIARRPVAECREAFRVLSKKVMDLDDGVRFIDSPP